MKKYGFLLLLALMLWLVPMHGQAAAASNAVYLDGKALSVPAGVKIELVQNNVMIPLRVVAEGLGSTVGWDQKSGTVTIQNDASTIELVVNNNNAVVNGSKVKLAAPPLLRGGTSVVPLRFVSEQMGLKVSWDNKAKSAYLTSPVPAEDQAPQPAQPTPVTGGGSAPSAAPATVNSISFADGRLLIAASGAVNPSISTLTGPDRLVVDLPNTAFSSQFGLGQPLDQKQSGQQDAIGSADVSRIRYSLFNNNPSTIRVVLDLNAPKSYTLSQDSSGLITVTLTDPGTGPTPPVGAGGKKVLVLDAGHGFKDVGTTGILGNHEKDFNLSVTLKVADLLKSETGIDLVLTRSDDTYPTLAQRAQLANDLHADAFISIHANSVLDKPDASGTETYYYNSNGKELATIMHKHLLQATGFKDRKVKTERYQVLRQSNGPATLLEVGFLSNLQEDMIMLTDDFQQRVAQGIVDGIKEYFKL
ncbi:N-acetylmuramoyl-L-alanine amidase family protein [Paenibacillus sp. JX-17]|uniref:N-acetylmuramoyl-L-alanine amidase family protein n=1 Tax=Paenibacillus lacisoli TaxID=3064525 RepID=A0ABT9C7K3_9BACL|nr:N-acetylmuramoyl-L-alanine amidase family protein [Paenibacillus sp. JX-17]MDO7905234.1 N-acetylmuramoyl-L-alanine amidase family protein [Paenibacillus sp. JX-17]